MAQPAPIDSNVTPNGPTVGRGKNFSAIEERQLCLSFLHISQDPIIGNGQKVAKFWARIDKHYNDRKPTGADYRPARSLESKWSSIKHDVTKFVASYQAVVALNESGTNEQDQIDKALQLYKQSHPKGHSFTFLESWRILKDVPKWNELGDKSLKVKQPKTKHSGQGVLSDISNSPQMKRIESTSPDLAYGMKRPQGTKAAKESIKKAKLHDSALQEQIKASQSMAEASLMKATLNLFSMDTSGMDALGREYLQLRKSAELAKLKRQLYEMGEVVDEIQSNPMFPGGSEPCASTAYAHQPPSVARRTPLHMPSTPVGEVNEWEGDAEIVSDEED